LEVVSLEILIVVEDTRLVFNLVRSALTEGSRVGERQASHCLARAST